MTAAVHSYRAIQHPTIEGAWTVQKPGCPPADLIIASKTNAEANAAARNQKEGR